MKEATYNNPNKVYVTVQAKFFPDGRSPVPEVIWWEDGRQYEVDRVTDARRAASQKAGGIGIRYQCSIRGKTVDIYYEDENRRWFMERKTQK